MDQRCLPFAQIVKDRHLIADHYFALIEEVQLYRSREFQAAIIIQLLWRFFQARQRGASEQNGDRYSKEVAEIASARSCSMPPRRESTSAVESRISRKWRPKFNGSGANMIFGGTFSIITTETVSPDRGCDECTDEA
jgi:hypothetical protein